MNLEELQEALNDLERAEGREKGAFARVEVRFYSSYGDSGQDVLSVYYNDDTNTVCIDLDEGAAQETDNAKT